MTKEKHTLANKVVVSPFELSGKVLASAAAAGGCLYIMGWSYANTLFSLWGIPLISLNISRDHFFSFGILAIQSELAWFLLLLLLAVGSAVFLYFQVLRGKGSERLAWSLCLIFSIVFVSSSYFGRWSARSYYEAQLRLGFPDFDRAIFFMSQDWLKGSDSSRAINLRHELTELGCYRIVFFGSEIVWAARPHNGVGLGEPAELPSVISIPSKSIEVTRVLQNRENCD
jgi:hypothetical protein